MTSHGRVAPDSKEGLARWLAFLGTSDCPCPSAWKSLGILYGVSMGKGWVRMETDPACRHHGKGTQASHA